MRSFDSFNAASGWPSSLHYLSRCLGRTSEERGMTRRIGQRQSRPSFVRRAVPSGVLRTAQGIKVDGLKLGVSASVNWAESLFAESGDIRDIVRFADLARHVYFTETGEPLPRERVTKSPFIGNFRGVGIYLLYNGILGDKSADGGNVLTRAVIAQLRPFDGLKVIYCAGCLVGRDRLQLERILVRQIPYEIRVS